MTKDELVSEIEIKLSPRISDDFPLTREYIAHVMDATSEIIKVELLNLSALKEKEIDNFYIQKTDLLNVQKEDAANLNIKRYRYFIELPYEPLNLYFDKGIHRVEDNYRRYVIMDSKENIESVKHLKFARPTESNLFGYREGRRIFLEGLGASTATNYKMIVYYVPSEQGKRTLMDEQYPISSDINETLIERTYQRIMGNLANGVQDDINDGN